MVMTDLDPKLTFDSFVIGPANRLASAAARRSAEAPGTSYNPLFIYSASGLGKSHILSAVAHQARKGNARLRVNYQTLEGYLQELTEALETGQRDAMRDRYRDLDVLLLDDVQFLANQPEAQEMLLGTLDSLTASGSQIVLASDRPPAEINGLDARLVSRCSGGLIVDIAAPEYETRVAIIRRKAEEQGHTLAPGVAEALARFPARNVRELGGVLNRVMAVQDLEGRPVTPEEVAKLMGQVPAAAATAAPVDDFASFLDEMSATVATTVVRGSAPTGCAT
jgi:chromosomal replication initiator protein